nr:biotin--[acetyl-CoA-carboxylase] ligase [Myxococcota bacterium]
PPGAGLYLSAVVRPPLPLAMVPAMTLAIGVGLCDAIRTFGAHAVLKWPNDALVDGRKLAGVLVEAHSQGSRLDAVIVGIGVNLTTAVLAAGQGSAHDALPDHAITLEEAAGRPVDRESFLDAVLVSVERWIDRYVAIGLPVVIPAWHERMAPRLVARASLVDEAGTRAQLVGEVAGLDGDGALLLRDGTGQLHRVRSGDVEVLRDPVGSGAVAATC